MAAYLLVARHYYSHYYYHYSIMSLLDFNIVKYQTVNLYC